MGLEQYSKTTQETAENLRIIDDALFRLIAEKKDVCQEILRTLLDMPELTVVKVTAQSIVKSLHREIALDALCILENGEYVNIEMQKGTDNDDVVRTRFHAAAVTSAYTPKGTDFSDIPQVTILYITEYDALNNNKTVTHVKRCMESKNGYVPVDDKEDIFFANTKVKDDTDKSKLLQLFLRKESFNEERFPAVSKAIRYFKETEGGRSEVCKSVENYAAEFAKDQVKESIRNERTKMIQTMLNKELDKKFIMDLGYSEEEIETAEKELLVTT